MKISVATLALASASIVKREDRALDEERRYKQLTAMMTHYNPDFDERKYWAYGCNCMILGDRPMSDPGHGPPVDALDTVCKKYKDCVKCARMTHGDTCYPENIKYKYKISGNDVVCKDSANTCDRSLCECDAMLAKQHVGVKGVFDPEFHHFWSVAGWDPKNDPNQCVSQPGNSDPQCCGGEVDAFQLYNANRYQCCPDKTVKEIGSC